MPNVFRWPLQAYQPPSALMVISTLPTTLIEFKIKHTSNWSTKLKETIKFICLVFIEFFINIIAKAKYTNTNTNRYFYINLEKLLDSGRSFAMLPFYRTIIIFFKTVIFKLLPDTYYIMVITWTMKYILWFIFRKLKFNLYFYDLFPCNDIKIICENSMRWI